eukprot:gnl/TRDRNA2_/TRDRNA2_156792_c0_seq3.p1 gnl/TRDRNA2_/TRDRNA2_156792_c0~~gnl/TRDRNA2_/TRDRNA2_156792_c0_seq3.p1  ORF type:complete len:456 (+),score=46.40 gnl/TRDRNA2_/TRDRNA2_156792_c0_seq3:61-1428(+)
MQGGAVDGPVRLAAAIDAVKCDNRIRKSTNEEQRPPLDTFPIVNEILLSPAADAWLLRARAVFAVCLAMPISWLHLDATVEACCSRKQKRVMDGAEFVVRLQQRYRMKILDVYFSVWSFFAEEEFYLLSLPILFWNVDYRYARQMTFIVCWGLLWGNLMKDVFRLPRPRNVDSRVWVPHSASQIDSTACRDFGFPSTHSMNSLSNAVFTVLYCLHHGDGGSQWIWHTGLASLWIFSITFGRLYLGVHSPMDVKGGLNLGLVVAMLAHVFGDAYDRLLLSTPHVGVLLCLFTVIILILHPQPRPMTPTFMQNCVVLGLIFGCAVGFRMETDRRAGRGFFGLSEPDPQLSIPTIVDNHGLLLRSMRTVLGYSIVMITRQVLKSVFISAFKALGFNPSPSKPKQKTEQKSNAIEIKGSDLFAAACCKTAVYATLAWAITCGCPAIFELVLRMPCEMNG